MDEVVQAHGITSVQYTALAVLARNPGLTAARLARNSFVRLQSMAQLVGALEARGLVERRRDPASRRQNLISITEEGRTVLEALAGPVAVIEAEMLAGMTRDQVTAFAATLTRMRHALSGTHPH
nr:MarR family transcriptional regulator [Microbacterium immunditiarum]